MEPYTPEMKLYQVEKCPFAHRVRVVLEEKKLPYEVEFFTRGMRPAELEALSPDARSPTLFDGDVRVWDSLVICEYLDERYADDPILPRDPALRARVRLMMKEVDSKLVPLGQPILDEISYKESKAGAPDETKVAEAMGRVRAALETWQSRLESSPFLLDSDFTLADIALFTPLVELTFVLGERDDILSGFSQLRTWRDRVATRPSAAY